MTVVGGTGARGPTGFNTKGPLQSRVRAALSRLSRSFGAWLCLAVAACGDKSGPGTGSKPAAYSGDGADVVSQSVVKVDCLVPPQTGGPGTGFFIEPKLIMTVAHIFTNGEPGPELCLSPQVTSAPQAGIMLVEDWELSASWSRRDPAGDIALLRVAGEGTPIEVKLDYQTSGDQEAHALGFQDERTTHLTNTVEGGPLFTSYMRPEHGMSGGPLFVVDRSKPTAIGLLVHRSDEVSRSFFAISVSRSILAEMRLAPGWAGR